ncbi:site-specific integrase [Corynebacterium sp. 13CS0277]|uniref:tyrosine-type recombinase/integrase n=1 Tax=Corynebacterium sp. 13CS0277 TaxID=2071994 RepID=UPI000D03D55F|nr:site-specific integrase [Corynebacterium sp. 13CS0277]PRQ12424.1 site-specific integrase [Corynebacterium sp. 13CS0277]
MASIKKYNTAKGVRWRVQYRSPDGRGRTKQGFLTRTAAAAWAAQNLTSIRSGTWIDPQAGATTVATLGAAWLATRTHLKPSSKYVEEKEWSRHVLPEWGHWKVSAIRHSDVQSWISRLECSPSSVRHYHSILAQILDLAVKDRMIPSNPARGVNLPRKSPSVKVFLTMEQLNTLISNSSKHHELLWLLGTTGLRWGEATGLQVQDIDFVRSRIHVRRNAVMVGSQIVVGTPKTHSQRTIAVSRRVLAGLRPVCEGKALDAWLWESRVGGPLRLPGKDGFFSNAVRRAQMEDPSFPTLTIHGLRHVAAGLMVSAGANVKVVQRQLGHASAAMTLDTYAELFDDDLDSVAQALNLMAEQIL